MRFGLNGCIQATRPPTLHLRCWDGRVFCSKVKLVDMRARKSEDAAHRLIRRVCLSSSAVVA
jgi:hypothetical protein